MYEEMGTLSIRDLAIRGNANCVCSKRANNLPPLFNVQDVGCMESR